MKTKYEAPEMSLMLVDVADVIATSGLKTNDTYDTTSGSNGTPGDWGALWS